MKVMAKCIIKEGVDVEVLRGLLRKKGYTLRAYKQPDGTEKYTLRKKKWIRKEIQ